MIRQWFSNWRFQGSKSRRTRARRTFAVERLSAPYARTLRFEAVEPRVLLAHTAPQLNPADSPFFTALAENVPIASNGGESVITMLQSLGASKIVTNQPLGNNFLSYDTSDNSSALEGMAVTGVGTEANGVWEFSLNGGVSWTPMMPSVSTANAVVLEPNDLMRFLPNEGFRGTVSIQLVAWDHTDLAADGSRVDLTLLGATGGSTAYSSAATTATLAVTPSVPPSFTLTAASHDEDNTVIASGGVPGGTYPDVISVPNFASNIVLGDGGAGTVTFTVSDPSHDNYSGLFSQDPAIDSQGTLTYKLTPDLFGTVYLNVSASNNGVVSAVQPTSITINQINDPPTLNPIANPAWVLDTAGQQTVNLSGITGGYDEGYTVSSVRAAVNVQSGDNQYLINGLGTTYGGASTGTVYYTPASGQNGTLHVTVTVTDDGGLPVSQTFMITVYSEPSYFLNTTGIYVANSAGPQTVPNLAESITAGYPNTTGSLSFTVTNNDSGVFSVQPAVNSSGTLTYTPQPGQHGDATVNVTLTNSFTGLSSTQSFSLYVLAPATAYPDTYIVNAGNGNASTASVSVGLMTNDVNPNSGVSMYAVIPSGPSHGSITLDSNDDGGFTYTPNSGFQGIDHFSYYDVVGAASNTVTDKHRGLNKFPILCVRVR